MARPEQSDVLLQFGLLTAPLKQHCRVASDSLSVYRKAVAQVNGGYQAWRTLVREFTAAAPDIEFTSERTKLWQLPRTLCDDVQTLIDRPDMSPTLVHSQLADLLDKADKQVKNLCAQVPTEWPARIFEANTPFTAYLRIREVVSTTRRQLHYIDRYLDPSFFWLYIEPIPRDAEIRLVTTAKHARNVLATSVLAEKEFKNYRLLTLPESKFHDRNLRVDDFIFSIGTSVKDAASKYLTNFGPSDNSNQAHQALDRLIAEAKPLPP